jgi:hypothetical protein
MASITTLIMAVMLRLNAIFGKRVTFPVDLKKKRVQQKVPAITINQTVVADIPVGSEFKKAGSAKIIPRNVVTGAAARLAGLAMTSMAVARMTTPWLI